MAYDPADFAWMLGDDVRREAHLRAIEQLIKPGDRVMDLGAGTGFFTLAALDAGAGHVTAIDVLDGIVDLPDALRDAGYENRASVYIGDVRELDVEPFDLIISDIRSQTGLCNDALEVLGDASRRLLTPEGHLIPLHETLHVALVSDPTTFEEHERTWGLGRHRLTGSKRRAFSSPRARHFTEDQVVSSAAAWAEIDYSALAAKVPSSYRGDVVLEVGSDDVVTHGFVVWFSTELCAGIGFDTAPGERKPVYSRWFLPFREPVELGAGTQCNVRLAAAYIDRGWLWDWTLKTGESRVQVGTLDATIPPGILKAERDVDSLRRDAFIGNMLADGLAPAEAAARAASENPNWKRDAKERADKLLARAETPSLLQLL